MKKILSVFVVLIGAISVLSCTNESENEITTLSKESPKSYNTIAQLEQFNKDFKGEPNAVTRIGVIPVLSVLYSDYKWAKRGVKAGQIIAGIAGAATGGTGYVATSVICGAVVGGIASYRKYTNVCTGVSVVLDHDNAMDVIKDLYNTRYSETHGLGVLAIDPYWEHSASINLPIDFSYLRRVGNDHNAILSNIESYTSNGITRAYLDHDLGDPTGPFIDDVFSDINLRMDTESAYLSITATSDGDSYCSSGSVIVDQIYSSFLSLMPTCTSSTSNMISAINGYINIIENNNELTDSEKEMVYAGFMIAFYSYEYWSNYNTVNL